MWPDEPFAEARGSFERPVLPPTVDPGASPTKTITISCQWLPYVRGALQQLWLQSTWKTDDPAVLLLAQQRAATLVSLFSECSSSSLPIACPYDFSGGSMDGFAPVHANGIDYAVWDGSGWEPGCTDPPGTVCNPFWQLQIFKSITGLATLTSITITYSSAVQLLLQEINDLSGSTICAPGTNVTAALALSASSPTVLRPVISTYPISSAGANFKILKVAYTGTSPSGVCP